MNRSTKSAFSLESATTFSQKTQEDPKDLGIEFVHFDKHDKPERQRVVPLGKFIDDTPVSSEEYLITRSLVALQASK